MKTSDTQIPVFPSLILGTLRSTAIGSHQGIQTENLEVKT